MGLCKVLVVFLIAASAVDARSPLSPAATFFRRLQQASSPSPANVAVPPSVTSPSPSDAAEGDGENLLLYDCTPNWSYQLQGPTFSMPSKCLRDSNGIKAERPKRNTDFR